MKIRHKLMSVPGLAVVLMVALVGLSAWALSRQQGTMHDLSDRQFADNVLALRARAEAAEAHSSVYRMMNWVALLDAAKLKEQQTALVARLARAEASLGELRARAGAAGDAAPIDLAVASQKTYRKQALDAVDLASVDANTGLAAMQGADTQYQVLAGQLDAIVARQGKGVVAAAAAADHDQARMLALLIGVGLLAALGTGIVSLLLARRIVRPIERATASARSIAEGDLTQPIDARGNDEVAQLLGAMQHMQASLTTVVGTVRQNSEGVASASAQIANGNHDLSQRTEEQASALEETAASMEQLSSTVRQNADNARQANQLAQSASTVAVQGGDVVGQVVATMKGINDSSRKIADIIGVIDGIAFQTNILALNAAVEAARAGEQGRGFAVVAGEVRSLAGRSADAAKEIKLLINASVERVAQGTALVDRAGTTMAEVVSSIRRVTDIMGEISTASSEQSAGVAQVGEAVSQMDRATQQNAALVEESAAAAESLKGQARELVQAVAVFRLDPASALAEAATDVAAGEDAAVGSDAGSDARRAGSQAGAPRVERRGPNRATNVTRPTFGTGPGPNARRTIGSTEH